MEQYYLNQAGNGIPLHAFSGVRYQKGHGFFGRFISSAVLPLLRYLGNHAVETGKGFIEDAKSSVTNRVLDTASKIAEDVIKHKKAKQTGEGLKSIKRKRKSVTKRNTKKKVKKRNCVKSSYDFLK